MKKLILILLFSIPALAFCQNPDSTYQYCLVKATGKILSNKVTIEVDYGQEQKLFSLKDNATIKEAAGTIKNFNSVIDALNYMASNGWKVVQSFVVTEEAGLTKLNVYNYLMEKRK